VYACVGHEHERQEKLRYGVFEGGHRVDVLYDHRYQRTAGDQRDFGHHEHACHSASHLRFLVGISNTLTPNSEKLLIDVMGIMAQTMVSTTARASNAVRPMVHFSLRS
jgi:hypothetical protein